MGLIKRKGGGGGLLGGVLGGVVEGLFDGGIGGGNIIKNISENISGASGGSRPGQISRDGGDFSTSLDGKHNKNGANVGRSC